MIASKIDLLSVQLAGTREEKQTAYWLFFCRRFVMLSHRMKRYSFTFVLGFLMLVFHPTALRGQSPGRFKISGTLTVTDIGSWRSIHKGVEQRKIAFLRSEPNYTLD